MVVLTSLIFTLILKTAHQFVEDVGRKMLALESHNAELLNLFELLPEGHMLISRVGKLGNGEEHNS